MAANMDTVGTFEIAKVLAEHQAITCIHKHYTVEEWKQFGDANPSVLPHVAVSAGTSDADLARVESVLANHPEVRFVCLDVANGYSEYFVAAVRKVREKHPNHIIIAGNVVTGEMIEELGPNLGKPSLFFRI